ncbi:MAG: hypothetical protein HYS86_04805 [Candidatus Chisholmbacteria bacterium]|nr:hypothetical protein [Candidatus Chisholmbacteria bacterium]
MTEPLHPFSTESGLSPLNALSEFPDEIRPLVVKALDLAAKYSLPSDDRLYNAQRVGGGASMSIENAYGDAADIFAKALNPSYKGWGEKKIGETNPEDVEALRDKYYWMIRTLSAGQIMKGLRLLQEQGLTFE